MSRLLLPAALTAVMLVLPAPRPTPPPKAPSSGATAQLLRDPSLSQTQIAFAFGGSIWLVARAGGVATRLTAGPGVQSRPVFSPDGSRIAFTGEYDGNTDVYVVAAAGGDPVRLTYHPAPDQAVGWTPDGKRVLFTSNRDSYARFDRLFTVAADGHGAGLPLQLPLPMAEDGSFSPDGASVAYLPVDEWARMSASWKRYRGGAHARVWLAKLADSSVVKVPNAGSNDINPMWIGDGVYFLSDRGVGTDGAGAAQPLALYRYDIGTRSVRRVADNGEFDIKSAQAGPRGRTIVYETMGAIHLLDLKSGRSSVVPIEARGDFPAARPHWENASRQIQDFAISPKGERAVFEAHGEILTVPAKHGDVRNLTRTPAVEERSPSWSPDGQHIAFFSDASGEYALHVVPQGGGEARVIGLGQAPSFFYTPVWSPDSKKIAYTDKRLNLWYVDLTQTAPTPVKVSTQTYDLDWQFVPAWSPDSEWLAYPQLLKSHMHAVAVYSLATKAAHQITDGLSDARSPVFDASGKYLYFAASTNLGQSRKGIDMTGIENPVTSSIYVAVLRKDLPSPLAPESNEEKSSTEKGAAKAEKAAPSKSEAKAPPAVSVDFDGISQRILALPFAAAAYTQLAAGKAGTLFFGERAPVQAVAGELHPTVWRWDMEKRARVKVLENAGAWDLSADGEKILYRSGGGRGAGGGGARWAIASATGPTPVRPGEGALDTANLQVYVDPPAEWRQMYRETWRIERDFLYDPGAHGLDIPAAQAYYAQYLPGLVSRDDLNYLFNEMLGQITIGHMFVRGGNLPQAPHVAVGLLGADYQVSQGRYQFAKVYQGENWNPGLHAPLTQPGVNVKAGEYLLAVNGREVRATGNLYSFFEQTAGEQTTLRVGPSADGNGSRTVTVLPLASETALRNRAWMQANLEAVDKLSHGKLAYVYLPDTANGGYTNFNRYYYAQLDKQGAVLDERFNSGGDIADYIIDNLHRPQFASFTTREGEAWPEPTGSIYGPKVMITNFYAGSGGDAMPWMFRNAHIGPLVGTRTWGGLVGIGGYPVLMDGGTVTAPREAFYNMRGEWDVENHGVAPDYTVMLDPMAWRQGRDPQLEKAVEVCLALLAKNPPVIAKVPAYPNYHQPFGGKAEGAASTKAGGGGHRH